MLKEVDYKEDERIDFDEFLRLMNFEEDEENMYRA